MTLVQYPVIWVYQNIKWNIAIHIPSTFISDLIEFNTNEIYYQNQEWWKLKKNKH